MPPMSESRRAAALKAKRGSAASILRTIVPKTPVELLILLRKQYPNDSEAEAQERFFREARTKFPEHVKTFIHDLFAHVSEHQVAN